MRCAVKRGFFVLRDCGEPASNTCAECSRPTCSEHTVVNGGVPLCIECDAKKRDPEATYDGYEDNWAYSYRHQFYAGGMLHPFYSGRYYDSYYDQYDVRSFDSRSNRNPEEEDESDRGFLDS